MQSHLLRGVLLLSLSTVVAAQSSESVTLRQDDHGRSAIGVVGAQRKARTDTEAITGSGWTSLGPFGGDADDVAASPTSPNVVLVGLAPASGVGGTLYRSTDAASTWTELTALSGISVHDIEFAANGDAFLGTLEAVWQSTDDGVTWTQLPLGIGLNDQALEVTLDPNNPTHVWAGIADALGSQTQNVLHSTDGGTTWTDRTPAAAAGLSCRGIALDPGDSNKVIAAFGPAFGGGAVFVSSNGGVTWTDRSAGLPANPMNDVIHDGSRILLAGGMLFGGQDVGLYETSDDGVSWTAIHDGTWPNLVIQDIELDPGAAGTIYAGSAGSGVFKSTDGGITWSFGIGGTASLSVNEVSVDASGGAPVYAGSSSVAVFKSTDGTNFAGSSEGIGALNLESIAANPNDSGELAVAFQGQNDGGVYSSTDGGANWLLEPLPGTRYNTVRFAPDGTLYALSDGPTTIADEGLYRRDPGNVWVSLGPDQGTQFESELFALAFSDGDPDLIVSGGADFGVAGFEPTVWVSDDAGQTWTKTYEGADDNEDVRDIVILPDGTDQTLVAAFVDFGTFQTGGALRSTDGGQSWSDSSSGVAAGAQCYSLDVSPFDTDTLYLSDDDVPTGAVYRSLDGGQTWTNMGFTDRARAVVADPLHPGRLFVAASTGVAVQVSEDEGASATAFDAGLSGNGGGRDLFLAPGPCNRLLLATTTGAFAEDEAGCMLESDQPTYSVAVGGAYAMSLGSGLDDAGRLYLVFGSFAGTDPGFTLAGIDVPLNLDDYSNTSLARFNSGPFVNTFGALDGQGLSAASIVLSSPADASLIGRTVHHVYGVFTLGPFTLHAASNALSLDFVP